MWPKLKPLLGAFPSAVISACDADGYPASLRTAIAPDDGRQVVGVAIPAHLALQPGPASLLLHSHNEQLWDLQTVVVRGALEVAGDGWHFRPIAIASGADSGAAAVVGALLGCRRNARRYLEKRGLARPCIPWSA